MSKVFRASDWPVRRCTGPCNQGRGPGRPGSGDPCPCPEACELPEAPRTAAEGQLSFAALVASALIVLYVLGSIFF